ncbi:MULTISPECIES: homospermidine biosynthesis protein [unclassified Chroococcidiopsis]|jgi:deoxyhypusine synthase|uniref:homospermidine biosynthesis protein n=1 Tax=unclassified Chroococcidiopsis TaxID=2646205 RepID=UPI000B66BB35|nr:deoxyhypusine synthase [Chroococcidiopsis sp. SAG 2025]MBE9015627.1 deoxyhypusine synthase [Chroococcidiopsidales cyanobacterium LEGE 13417]MDV2992049.1 Deoxyhypusine synthase-like protein [Chroococcidiopsis sp. SAG 2025]OWY65964.1 deoxyhypusine synthase [cyanobacterium TDX16]PSB42465.1 deoxyhypusine synthase [Cyanosarcina cf. burmensis CCALA 770]
MSKLPSNKIDPAPMTADVSVVDLIDNYFTAYNSARLREICQLLSREVFREGVTVGLSLSGAMTPAGYGVSALAPLIRHGFIDWAISTGANLYHDMHYGLGFELYKGNPFVDDVKLRQEGTIRIYDIMFGYDVLLETDAFIRKILQAEPFQKRMGTAEFHYLLGKYIREVEKQVGVKHSCLLATAYECGVPIYTSSPGDSSIGMNVAALALEGSKLILDPSLDVNETAAIAYSARESEGKSAALILGGGSPKNFLLQTQPQLHEVLGLEERGHDYFIQFTDARPDTGGLSGATPSEAVSWGKIDPEELPSTVVCYTDSTIALPLVTAYVLNQCPQRPLKRLYDRREQILEQLRTDYLAAKTQPTDKIPAAVADAATEQPIATYPCGRVIPQHSS